MKTTEREVKLLDFLRNSEEQNQTFTLKEASEYTGYKPNTVSKYFTEDLKGKYLFKQNRRTWFSKNINTLSDNKFFELISQTTKYKEKTTEENFFEKLTERSLDSFTLALEVYNRPSLKNRVEAFSIMIINAWELLLKARISKEKSYNDIFYSNGNSLAISDTLKTVFYSECPIKTNIEAVIELRDQATHLLIPEIQSDLSELFQANVLNYQEQYKALLGNSPLSGQSVGMLSLIIDGPKPELAVIKNNYGNETAKKINYFLNKVQNFKDKYNSTEFAVTIDYQLTLSKNKSESDINLVSGKEGQEVTPILIPKPLDKTHPYFRNQAVVEINKRHGKAIVTTYNFHAVISKHRIENKAEFYDHTDRKRYSESFIDWFVKNLQQNNWLKSAITSYQNSLSKNKKPAK